MSVCSVLSVRIRFRSVRHDTFWFPGKLTVTNIVQYSLYVVESRPSDADGSLQPAIVIAGQGTDRLVRVEHLIPGPGPSAVDQQLAGLYVVLPTMSCVLKQCPATTHMSLDFRTRRSVSKRTRSGACLPQTGKSGVSPVISVPRRLTVCLRITPAPLQYAVPLYVAVLHLPDSSSFSPGAWRDQVLEPHQHHFEGASAAIRPVAYGWCIR